MSNQAHYYKTLREEKKRVRQTPMSEDEVFDRLESYLFGFFRGVSFLIADDCLDGINASLYNGFRAISYRNSFTDIMKFTDAYIDFNEAWGVVVV